MKIQIKEYAPLWIVICLLIAMMVVTVAIAQSTEQTIVETTAVDGIDAIWAALGAILAGIAGAFLKRPQDYMRERRERINGSNGKSHDIGKLAYDAIVSHELKCEERYREIFDLIREDNRAVRKEIGDLRETIARLDERTKSRTEINHGR